MSEKFSATLRIGDLNDFIAPAQGCVVSLKNESTRLVKSERLGKDVVASKPSLQSEAVKISLKDCLACSGCVTSAETVMLEEQSTDEFLSNINKGKTVVVSLSPQSRTSLAVHFNISPLQAFRKLTTFFKLLGVKAIFDTSCSRDITLIESCNEFVERYKQSQSAGGKESNSRIPMISSACPGWICYAEKTLGSYILPFISSVKSPQQIIGAVIKNFVYQKLDIRPEEIYHVTVMPCYDKKLEASRDDFKFNVDGDGEEIKEVDSVLTTREILELIQSKAIDFKALEESSLDKLLTNIDDEEHLYGVPGSSGGYAETVFRFAAKILFGREVDNPLKFIIIKNSDFQEVSLEVEGKTVLKFALCYGFRNLQNVVRKIKMGKCDYHFLEIMACPSGCLNGGGQIKPNPGQSGKELIQMLEKAHMENVLVANPSENPIIKRLYEEWLGYPGSEKAKRYLHTEYHPIVKSITSQLQNW